MKHCETMQQECPNRPQCTGECDSLKQHLQKHQIEMKPSWRDLFCMSTFVCWFDVALAVAMVIFAGWLGSYLF